MLYVPGGWSDGFEAWTGSTEFWPIDNDIWVDGPNLPQPISHANGLTTPDNRRLLLIGGYAGYWTNPSATIYQLSCWYGQCQWTKMPAKLSGPRARAVAMLIPESNGGNHGFANKQRILYLCLTLSTITAVLL